jgi:multidrug efflux pump subunit AcrA (membrane-fusion protein)
LQSAIYNLNFLSTGAGSGIIDELDVTVGQKVTKGQVLAKLNKTALQDAYNQQVAAVNAANANVFNAQAALNNAQNSANATNAASQTQLNGSQNNQNAAQNVSSETIDADQTALDNAQTALDQTRASANATKSQAQAQLNSDINACHVQATATANAKKPTPTPTPTPKDTGGTGGDTGGTGGDTGGTGGDTGGTGGDTGGTGGKAGYTGGVKTALSKLNIDSASMYNDTCTSLAQAKYNSTIETADTSVQNAETAVDNAESKLSSDKASANQTDVTNQSTVNNNKASVNTSKASGAVTVQSAQTNLTTALNNLKTAQLQLEQAKHNLDNATLTAPHSGTVTTINGTVGSAPGTPPNASQASTTTSSSTFIQIVDTGVLQVVANVNETDTANLKVGEKAQFTVNAYGDRTFTGTISQISPNGQTVSNVVTYPVYIDVDKNSSKDVNLFPGMTANVSITVLQRDGVLLIPVDAINFARLASGNGATTASTAGGGVPQLIDHTAANAAMVQARKMRETLMAERDVSADNPLPAIVIVKNANGQYVAKPVVLGLSDGTNYEVLDGLTAQDNVVVGILGGRSATGTSGATGGGPNG